MTQTTEDAPFDAEAVRAKYRAERDKRLIKGRADIRDLRRDEFFARFRADPFTPVAPRAPITDEVEVAIIGAGLAGILAAVRLQEAGLKRIRLIDEAGGVGGTWYWNRYPGVMCDVESYVYMPMLEELGYIPSRKYAFGDEIRAHLQAIAEKYDLVADALFHTRIAKTEWDEDRGRWLIRSERNDVITARYVVMATGILNLMKLPVIPGMETFKGKAFHSGRWDYDYTGGRGDLLPPVYGGGEEGRLSKLADKVVAFIGTGASAVQALPAVAESAKQLYVFQRTPSAVGIRNNRFTDPAAEKIPVGQPGWQWERMVNFQRAVDGVAEVDLVDDGWTHHFGPTRRPPGSQGLSGEALMHRMEAFDYEVMELHRQRVDEVVEDPRTGEVLKPYFRYICGRPLFHDEYLPAFNRPSVELIDCPAGIERVTEDGLIVNGKEYKVDCIIYATGFEPETTSLPRRVGHEVVGRHGVRLADKCSDAPATLFGMLSHGFPNMFFMPCPGHQSVITVNHTLISVVGAEHLGDMVKTFEDQNVEWFDVTEEAEADWIDGIRAAFIDGSAIVSACTPSSRLNFEELAKGVRPEGGSYGGGFGDFYGFVDLLKDWRAKLAAGEPAGLELHRAGGGS